MPLSLRWLLPTIVGVAIAAATLVQEARTGDLTPAEVCADPSDCRLREAGQIPGVGIGFVSGVPRGRPRQILLDEANIGVNHAFSWNTMWPERDRWSFEAADAIATFHRDNGLRQAAFHFAWEQTFLDDLPPWVLAIDDPGELRTVLAERATVIFDRYPDLDRINVINEPLPTLGQSTEIHQNHFFRVLGPDYIVELFHIVDAVAPPSTELVLNENFIEYFPLKAEGLVRLVEDLLEKGAPIDSVGFQTHLMLTEIFDREPDFDLYEQTMRHISQLGLDVWISELDNPVDPARPDRLEYQAANYRRAVEACLSVARCSDIVVWGVQDLATYWFALPYAPSAPLLFDQSFAPKPAYFAVREALLAGRPLDADDDGVEDGVDNCPNDINPEQHDLDADSIGDVCDPADSTLFTLARATVWATGNKLGRAILRGELTTGVLGSRDVLDTSNGVRLRVRDADDLDVVIDFVPSECETRPTGKIHCLRQLDPQKKLRLVLRPHKRRGAPPGRFEMRARLQGLNVARGLAGPLTVTLTTGDIDREGRAPACGGGDSRLLCRG